MLRLAAGVLLAPMLLGAGRDIVVIDTDSGLFGDDGAALVMLMRSPTQVAVQAITVVSGNVWVAQGAEYMMHLLDVLKRPGIPVYVGGELPLLHSAELAKEFETRWGALNYTGAFAMPPNLVTSAPGSKLSTRKAHADAAAYLIAEVERHPGEVTLLATGPMTNIALALRLKPSIENFKIKTGISVHGREFLGCRGNASLAAEFNFLVRSEAA